MAILIEGVKPFKVRASCGHIVIRKMREATAGVAYADDVVLDAPNGRACDECENRRPEPVRFVHLSLSDRNAKPLAIRAVYADGEQIGIVRQSREDGLWIADDMAGHCHGVSYTTDWNAAKQLALGLGMDPR